jgi:hypothetical protein
MVETVNTAFFAGSSNTGSIRRASAGSNCVASIRPPS